MLNYLLSIFIQKEDNLIFNIKNKVGNKNYGRRQIKIYTILGK